jgi:hypothetical protein
LKAFGAFLQELGLQETSAKARRSVEGLSIVGEIRPARSLDGRLGVYIGSKIDTRALRSYAAASIDGSKQRKVPAELETAS